MDLLSFSLALSLSVQREVHSVCLVLAELLEHFLCFVVTENLFAVVEFE